MGEKRNKNKKTKKGKNEKMKIKSVKTKLNGVGSCINDSEIE